MTTYLTDRALESPGAFIIEVRSLACSARRQLSQISAANNQSEIARLTEVADALDRIADAVEHEPATLDSANSAVTSVIDHWKNRKNQPEPSGP
jgi:hypothetical protein